MADMGKKQHGLTLIELMVTLAVAIILVTVGMPLFSGIVANNRATTQANTFLSAFKLARSEAVKRGTNVSVCAIADPAASPVVCGNNGNWGNGLLVFTDLSTAGVVDGSDVRIKVFANPSAGSNVTTPGAFVRFQAQGDLSNVTANGACAGSATCLQLGQTGTTGTPNRCLHVMNSGQTRLERAACS
jgi:type IV fimbrial biogenesis protein FimT